MDRLEALTGFVVSLEGGRELTGIVVEGPAQVRRRKRKGEPWREVVAFRLDNRPELELRQVALPGTVAHKAGDQVRVRYRQVDAGVALVEAVEKLRER